MAKVLKESHENPNLWKMEVTCSGKGNWYQEGKTPCYCLLEIYPMDIVKRINTDIAGVSDTYYGFICPKCGCFTELDTKNIPYHILSSAKNYNNS